MDCLNEGRNTELENAIENIVQDAHNKAIGECHHLVVELFDRAKEPEKSIYGWLEQMIVKFYKQ